MTIVLAIVFFTFYLHISAQVNADIVQSNAIANDAKCLDECMTPLRVVEPVAQSVEVSIAPTQQPVEIDDSDALTVEAEYQAGLVELSKLTIRELKALCKGSGIKNYSRLTKAQLLTALA